MTDKERNIDGLTSGVPFGVPEGYFDSFEANLLARMEKEELIAPKVTFKVRVGRIVASVAAAVALIAIAAGVVMYNYSVEANVESQFSEMSAYEEYIDNAYDEFGSMHIEDILADVEY